MLIGLILVLFSRRGSVWKVADFGLTSEATSRSLTTKDSRGSTGYRASELVNFDGKAVYSQKSDIWSMGCILYELPTGQLAFASD